MWLFLDRVAQAEVEWKVPRLQIIHKYFIFFSVSTVQHVACSTFPQPLVYSHSPFLGWGSTWVGTFAHMVSGPVMVVSIPGSAKSVIVRVNLDRGSQMYCFLSHSMT